LKEISVKNSDNPPAHSSSEWQIFSEILVPGSLSNEAKFERMVSDLREVGLNPFQVFHVLGRIDQSLQKLANKDVSMLVNVSTIGNDIKKPGFSEDENFESGDTIDYALGFFMVYKFVNDHDKNPLATHYISLDVLIYAE